MKTTSRGMSGSMHNNSSSRQMVGAGPVKGAGQLPDVGPGKRAAKKRPSNEYLQPPKRGKQTGGY